MISALDDQTDQPNHDRRDHQHRDIDVDAGAGARDGRVAAQHHELAVREIDDSHHAEHDREPRAGEHQERDHVQDFEPTTPA